MEERHFTFTLETLELLMRTTWEDAQDPNFEGFEDYWRNVMARVDQQA